MLSILIPERNYNCTKLVNDLDMQCINAGIVYEIIVMDNASTLFKSENRNIENSHNCRFVESEQNVGLAQSRNKLVQLAQYPHFLMIDSDAEIVNNNDFINRYIKAMNQAQVVVGSMCYTQQKPSPDRCLRWYYGKKRENRPASVRNRNPYQSLITFNLLMERDIVLRFPFEDQTGYGHDDTIMGCTLRLNNISVLHIDNPLIHNGLDLSKDFLTKSLSAVEKYLTYPAFQSEEMLEQIKIFRVFRKVQSLGLCRLLAFKFRVAKKLMEFNLCSRYPSLFIFDFYRLSYLCYFSATFKMEQDGTSKKI